jgi:hypothetical protein
MREKRVGWIKPEEVELIAGYLDEITSNDGSLRNWKICGPFENADGGAIRNALGPEQIIDFAASYPGRNNAAATWKTVEVTDPSGVLDFEAHFGQMDRATAYAYTTVTCDRDQRVCMRLSGDDMFELFVNGNKVLQRLMEQPFEYDKDMVPIDLVKGENRILVKVHDRYGPWLLRVRITESNRPGSPTANFTGN